MQFSLLTPEGELYRSDVEEVLAQGSEGDLGILAGHVPLMTGLKVAPLRVRAKGGEHRFAVYGGVLQVSDEGVTVLADAAHLPQELDRPTVLSRKQTLEAQLGRAAEGDDVESLRRELEQVDVQLEVIS